MIEENNKETEAMSPILKINEIMKEVYVEYKIPRLLKNSDMESRINYLESKLENLP